MLDPDACEDIVCRSVGGGEEEVEVGVVRARRQYVRAGRVAPAPSLRLGLTSGQLRSPAPFNEHILLESRWMLLYKGPDTPSNMQNTR